MKKSCAFPVCISHDVEGKLSCAFPRNLHLSLPHCLCHVSSCSPCHVSCNVTNAERVALLMVLRHSVVSVLLPPAESSVEPCNAKPVVYQWCNLIHPIYMRHMWFLSAQSGWLTQWRVKCSSGVSEASATQSSAGFFLFFPSFPLSLSSLHLSFFISGFPLSWCHRGH